MFLSFVESTGTAKYWVTEIRVVRRDFPKPTPEL